MIKTNANNAKQAKRVWSRDQYDYIKKARLYLVFLSYKTCVHYNKVYFWKRIKKAALD